MARPKSEKLPYFAELLDILYLNQVNKEIKFHYWGTHIKNVNTITEILVISSGDEMLDDWWNGVKAKDGSGRGYKSDTVNHFKNIKSKKFRYIDDKICKVYRKMSIEEAVDKLEKTICEREYKTDKLLDKELCLQILGIFRKSEALKESYYVNRLTILVNNNQFKLFFAHVLYHIASNFQRMSNSVTLLDNSKSKDANIDILYDLQSDFEKGLFYDSVVREIIVTPNPEQEVIETTTTTIIETKRLSSKNKNADYYTFTLGFEYEHFREYHHIESVEINNRLFTEDEIEIKEFEKEDSKWSFKKNYKVTNIEKSQTYNIKIVQKSIINFPVGEIIYRLPMSASKFKFIAKMSEINKKDKNNFKISGSFLGAFKHKDRVRFLESNNHLFEVEIDRYTPVGAGVKIDIRPHNKLLKYTPPE